LSCSQFLLYPVATKLLPETKKVISNHSTIWSTRHDTRRSCESGFRMLQPWNDIRPRRSPIGKVLARHRRVNSGKNITVRHSLLFYKKWDLPGYTDACCVWPIIFKNWILNFIGMEFNLLRIVWFTLLQYCHNMPPTIKKKLYIPLSY